MKPSEKRDKLIAMGLYVNEPHPVFANNADFWRCKSCQSKGGFWECAGVKKASIVGHHERYHPMIAIPVQKECAFCGKTTEQKCYILNGDEVFECLICNKA